MNKNRRICFISNHFPPYFIGGDAIYCFRLANSLKSLGYEVHVIHDVYLYYLHLGKMQDYVKDYPTFRSTESMKNIVIHRIIPKSGITTKHRYIATSCLYFTPWQFTTLYKEFSRAKFDLIHFQNFSGFGLTSLITSMKVSVPKVISVHDYWLICPKASLITNAANLCTGATNLFKCIKNCKIPAIRQLNVWEKICAQFVFIAPSNSVAKTIQKLLPSLEFKIVPYFMPLKTQPVVGDDELSKFRSSYRLNSKDKVILYVGKLEKYKGILVLLKAFKKLLKEISNVKLLIVGNGSLKEKIEIWINKRNLSKKIILTGVLRGKDLVAAYNVSTIFVAPTSNYYDPSPIVLLEAMANEKPVISSRIGGIPETIKDGFNGVLTDPGDVDSLANSLATVISDKKAQRKFVLNGKKILSKKFSKDAHLKKICGLYDSLLS